jgi:hypothetical protein
MLTTCGSALISARAPGSLTAKARAFAWQGRALSRSARGTRWKQNRQGPPIMYIYAFVTYVLHTCAYIYI